MEDVFQVILNTVTEIYNLSVWHLSYYEISVDWRNSGIKSEVDVEISQRVKF